MKTLVLSVQSYDWQGMNLLTQTFWTAMIFFIPSNYNSDTFFLFYIGEIFNPNPHSNNVTVYNNIYQSTLSHSSNNGLGGAIEKDKVILTDTNMMGTPINAVRHANGLDWWIITPNKWKNEFFLLLVDKNGAHYIGTQTIGTVPHRFSSGGQGQFSPDGSHFAWYSPYNGLFLYDFDRATGMLSNFRKIEIPAAEEPGTGGLEFSPSGRFLYVNHYFSLYQLDMLSEDIAGSLTHIADYDGFGDPPYYTTFLYQVRTPDGRIFMNPTNGSQWLHVIQEPEKKGIACRFEQHAIKLPTVNNFALPFFPNYRLGALGEPLCDSMIVSVPNPIGVVTSPCHIYPNPTTTSSTIYLPTQWSEAMVYTMDGLLIGKNKSNQNELPLTLDLADWTPGIYIIEGVERDGQRCVDKLIIH